jgi:hypothetical protein
MTRLQLIIALPLLVYVYYMLQIDVGCHKAYWSIAFMISSTLSSLTISGCKRRFWKCARWFSLLILGWTSFDFNVAAIKLDECSQIITLLLGIPVQFG